MIDIISWNKKWNKCAFSGQNNLSDTGEWNCCALREKKDIYYLVMLKGMTSNFIGNCQKQNWGETTFYLPAD